MLEAMQCVSDNYNFSGAVAFSARVRQGLGYVKDPEYQVRYQPTYVMDKRVHDSIKPPV
ncbi:MAG: hypothetical protein GY696_19660 [Gammaproteobacteria bacterium]|nr:hypothetical protein [Gammaproteobacteria bacterium]